MFRGELQKPTSVHRTLAKSYLSYFLLCSFGLFLGIFFPIKFSVPHMTLFGIVCFGVGPLLIWWAQYTSRKFEVRKQETGKPQFYRGPYKYVRNPTQLGLLILVLGYAFISQTLILFLSVCVAYIISNVFFKKHETILESRYGEQYTQYKSSVRKIM